ncbi:glutathione S-transferase 1-like [Babylonia areolata]|uniref:glutathione S-transferase 1-like n=1 Tax=Babylonia areolata TaxID=304850 RepID=UPI003FCF92B5
MAGDSSVERLRNDEVVHLVQDWMNLMATFYYEQDLATRAELREKLLKTEVPRFCGIFDRLLAENGHTGHFVGTKLSQADLAVYDMVTNIQVYLGTDLEAGHPGLTTLRHTVESYPRVMEYLTSRKAPLPKD